MLSGYLGSYRIAVSDTPIVAQPEDRFNLLLTPPDGESVVARANGATFPEALRALADRIEELTE